MPPFHNGRSFIISFKKVAQGHNNIEWLDL